MSQDIRIQNENSKFKFRVAGIVENEEKVLIVRINENPFYCFPGGHVELFEDTKTALDRELKEELFFDVEIKTLIASSENFYFLRDSNYHELCYYYTASPKDNCISMQDKIIEEQDKFGMVIHRFKWVDKNKLLDYDVRPKDVVQHFLSSNNLNHFVTRE